MCDKKIKKRQRCDQIIKKDKRVIERKKETIEL